MPSAATPELDQIQGVLHPAGYRILVKIPNLESQMKNWGNIVMPEETRAAEEMAQLTAQVIAKGPDAYQDKSKFPNGDWCEVGDYIVMRAYAGTRISMRAPDGSKVYYALINDDTVQAVVRGGDPQAIERP